MKKTKDRTNSNGNIADIYVRVSGEYDERTASLDSQETECRKLIEQHGFVVGNVWIERHTGKHLHQRGELSKLRKRIEQGEIQCAAFYEIDRFTRGGAGHIWILLHEARTRGVKLLCPTQDLSDTFENNTLITIKAETARRELELIKDRTMRGRREKLKKGMIAGQGGNLFGYRKIKETWTKEIIDEQAEVIREIFDLAPAMKTRRAIAMELQRRGIPTPSQLMGLKRQSSHWSATVIRQIIRNPAYKGEDKALYWTKTKDGRQVKNDPENVIQLPNTTPAIVDPETWRLANEALDSTSADYTRNLTNFVLLRNLVWCMRCRKKAYVMRAGKTRLIDLFRCSSVCHQGACGAATVSTEWLARRVWEKVSQRFKSRAALEELIANLSKGDSKKESLLQDQTRYEKRIEDIERQIERLVRSVARSDDDTTIELYEREIKSLGNQRKEIEDALSSVRALITEAGAHEVNIPHLLDLHNAIVRDEHFTDEEKREYLIEHGFRVYFDGRAGEVYIGAETLFSKFDPETSLIAYDNGDPKDEDADGYNPGESEGFVPAVSTCKRLSRSRTTSGRRAMCR